MKMISVQERKKNMHSFMNSYPSLCKLQDSIPNPIIKIDSSNNILDFYGDRLKQDDWKPILEAISNDRTLHVIRIRSKHYAKRKVLKEGEGENESQKTATPKTSPVFKTSLVLKITEALSKCLKNSAALTGLSLEKIPLDADALNYLIQGLEVCQCLQQLSLPFTRVGDDGCASLCFVLRRRLSLVCLDLTGCDLTDKGVGLLCNLLKFQKLNRYGESWKQSLRCRPVNPNIMPGLRRLTLNHNPIGDAGVKIIVDTLIDDLWLKAIDLQHCDVSLVGGTALFNLVKENQFLSVVDVRGNMRVPKSLVAAIVQQLADNNRDSKPEFQWLKEDHPKASDRSGSGSSVSRTAARLASTSSLSTTKGLSVLPSKARLSPRPVNKRSLSAKGNHTTNNTPRPPWNWNHSNPSLRRGNSDQLMARSGGARRDILEELQSVKEQLQQVSQRLEEETRRRVRIEEELAKYERLLEPPEGSVPLDRSILQAFYQYYTSNLAKSGTELQKVDPGPVEEPSVRGRGSVDSLIRTMNGENAPRSMSPSSDSHSSAPSSVPDAPTRAQLLFETLLSS